MTFKDMVPGIDMPYGVASDGTVAYVREYRTRGGNSYSSVVFTYVVVGSWYGGTYTTSTAYAEGDPIALEYDPAHPERNNLSLRQHRRQVAYRVLIALAALLALYGLNPPINPLHHSRCKPVHIQVQT